MKKIIEDCLDTRTSLTSCGVNEAVCTILESPNVPRATVYTAHRGTSTTGEEQPTPALHPVVLAFGLTPCNREAYRTRRPRLPCKVLARYVSTWGRRWRCYHALTFVQFTRRVSPNSSPRVCLSDC
ncbi:hypothetical protein Fot_20369 [Forsythia ovata]|uniref:Uncharacterized protein n=1 Tax=Forsythia ovata TaxID=205694 RepID=A0ABD1VNT1_9LAMI